MASFPVGSDVERLQQLVDHPLAVAEAVQMNADLLEQSQVEVCQWRRLVVPDVTSALHAARSPASHQDRQVGVVVDVWISPMPLP